MKDAAADVLHQRAALDRGVGAAVAVSLLLHVALAGLLAMEAIGPQTEPAKPMVNIRFASAPKSGTPSRVRSVSKPAVAPTPKEAEPAKPRIEDPKPLVPDAPKKADKNTVPFSPFGRSTKKGSETPAVATPKAPAAAAGTTTAGQVSDVPVGGSGVTGLEGGDFPYTLYIDGMQRRIGTNWFRPQIGAGPAVTVYFRIERDGRISDAQVETPSGNPSFDRAALSAVRSSSPLNPLPYGYAGTWLGVHLTFR